jgi:hypothetical protein
MNLCGSFFGVNASYSLFFLNVGLFCFAVVFGCRLTVVGLMNLPVMDDLLIVFVPDFLAIAMFSF